MSEVPALQRKRDITQFNPAEAKENIKKAEAVIEYAKDIKDWPLLESAVSGKIEEIRDTVIWWDAKVRSRGRPK